SGIWNLEFGIWNLESGIIRRKRVGRLTRSKPRPLEFGIWNLEFGIWNLEFYTISNSRFPTSPVRFGSELRVVLISEHELEETHP
ncbi:MAG: hypothetical protein WAV20_23070, partial [Blastocatellia bacterium]